MLALALAAPAQTPRDVAFAFFEDESYEKALPLLENLLRKAPEDPKIVYRIGGCHLMLNNDRAKAVPFLEKASTMKGVPDLVWFDLGSAYRYANELDKAKINLEKFIGMTRDGIEKEAAKLMLKQLGNARELMSHPVDVDFVNLGPNINSEFDDIMPFVSRGNDWMYFTSKRIYSKGDERYIYSVYNSDNKRNEWKKAVRSKTVNSDADCHVVGKSPADDRIFVLPLRYDLYDDICQAEIVRGQPGAQMLVLPEPVNYPKTIESGATVSATGDTLIFASNRKGGYGGLDLYMSVRLPNNTWSQPVNLGPSINTPYDDDFPALSDDSRTLWFASQGHNSMGGFDMFAAKAGANGGWESPKNLRYPINNFYDNTNICYTSNSRYAYVADVRPGGHGGFDIYQLVFRNTEETIYIMVGTLLKGSESAPVNVTAADRISITVLCANSGDVMGVYNYDYNNNRFVIALPPGNYKIVVSSDTCALFEREVKVDDVLVGEEFDLGQMFLKGK